MLTRMSETMLVASLIVAVGACADPGELDTLEHALPVVESSSNVLTISADDTISWNGNPVSLEQLPALFEKAGASKPEPELRFEPSMESSYEVSAQVLMAIRESGLTKFGFVGNEKHVTPSDKNN